MRRGSGLKNNIFDSTGLPCINHVQSIAGGGGQPLCFCSSSRATLSFLRFLCSTCPNYSSALERALPVLRGSGSFLPKVRLPRLRTTRFQAEFECQVDSEDVQIPTGVLRRSTSELCLIIPIRPSLIFPWSSDTSKHKPNLTGSHSTQPCCAFPKQETAGPSTLAHSHRRPRSFDTSKPWRQLYPTPLDFLGGFLQKLEPRSGDTFRFSPDSDSVIKKQRTVSAFFEHATSCATKYRQISITRSF
jgi:hypothetical protein